MQYLPKVICIDVFCFLFDICVKCDFTIVNIQRLQGPQDGIALKANNGLRVHKIL